MIKKVKRSDIKKQNGRTDWNHLKKDESKSPVDPEAPELNVKQLSEMKPPKN
jgi:hypothetical protein